MKNGQTVAAFEREFAAYVGAKYAIALCNGTATLHAALAALDVQGGERVSVPPLTMASTAIAVMHQRAVPVFEDVDPRTWLMAPKPQTACTASIGVSLYGLHYTLPFKVPRFVDDAAQTLRPHNKFADFTSYSFQASKILALGEGGMLVTNDEALATRAREFSSLGYRMRADQPRIDPAALKSPTFDRHYSLGWNYRMNDLTAAEGLRWLYDRGAPAPRLVDIALHLRAESATAYRNAIADCDWLTPQHVPDGFTHDMWTFAVACDSPDRAQRLADAVVKHGGERPYPAWKLTYQEPAFRHLPAPSHRVSRSWIAQATGMRVAELPADIDARDMEFLHGRGHGKMAWLKWREGGRESAPNVPSCPVAESLQPRLLQFQTNDLASAERNAGALRKAIEELS